MGFLIFVKCVHLGVVGQQLQSVNILRKYSSFLDLAISYITSNVLFVSRSSEVWKAQVIGRFTVIYERDNTKDTKIYL